MNMAYSMWQLKTINNLRMNIALLGYGKMGKEIEQIAISRKHNIVLKIDVNNAGELTADNLKKADVAIEFSTPANAISNIYNCFNSGIPVVVGTTGWLDKLDEVKKKCSEKNGGLFHASNFSLGVNIFFNLNKHLAKIMNVYPDYDVNMEEIHHIHKLDSPSGTGLSLANQILEAVERKNKWIEGEPKSTSELSIHAKREGEVPGTHIVRYQSSIDDIEIKHVAHNRKGFALGAVLAAEFMQNKKGVFGMQDLLKF